MAEPLAEELREIRLQAEGVQVALLRGLDGIQQHEAVVGGTVFINMPEMGVEGHAEVLAIEDGPEMDSGSGRLVLSTFQHVSGDVVEIATDRKNDCIGVTASHPVWSVDRDCWISVQNLEVGETLRTMVGETRLISRTSQSQPKPVFNIEVATDHCYRVGDSGVLVHNASPGGVFIAALQECSCGTTNLGLATCKQGAQGPLGKPSV